MPDLRYNIGSADGYRGGFKVTQTRSIVVLVIVVKWVKIFKTGKTIEIQLVRPTEVCGNVLSEKNAYKSIKTAMLLSNVINADHQNSCLFTNKAIFQHLYGF